MLSAVFPRCGAPLLCALAFCAGALSQSGPAAGAPAAASSDTQSRPITAGGFVEGAPIVFSDLAKSAGLASFRLTSGDDDKRFILETTGAGVAIIDFDNDGWQDIYLVNGGTLAALKVNAPMPKAALFRNNHNGTFTDVTAKAGVGNERWGMGAVVGDYDNDGWSDLYVTNFGPNRLYRNNGDGTFTDVAPKAGVAINKWSTGATFGDYNGDGYLDLFVPGYVQFDMNNPPIAGGKGVGSSFCQYRGENVMCGPRGLKGERDHLFRNNGNGAFTETSEAAGVADLQGYYGFSSAFVDVNDDARLDLLVVNDSTPRYLYLNKGDGTFEDASYASGFAVNAAGREQAGMGLGIGDYRNSGRVDLYITNFSDDYNTLYQDEGDGNFTDVSFDAAIAEPTVPFLGWGTAFIDYDNDGWKDVIVANGHVYRKIDHLGWGTTWAQRPLLFRNVEGKKFEPVAPAPGSGLAQMVAGRGLAVADFWNNGKLGAVVNNIDAAPLLLRNEVKSANHWIAFKLIGGPKSPKDAIGACVKLTAGGKTQRADVVSGASFLSGNDLRVHFGLGPVSTVEKLEVRWPSGETELVAVKSVDEVLYIEEGRGIVPAPKPKPTSKPSAKSRKAKAKAGKLAPAKKN
jgi:enediyne biosynthesis protein E4